MVVLNSVGLSKKDKNGEWKLAMKVEKWTSGVLKEWFPSSNYINKCKSPCFGEGYRNRKHELFIHLGGIGRNMDDADNFPNPKISKICNCAFFNINYVGVFGNIWHGQVPNQ